MELQYKQTKSVSVTSYSFISGDVNNFVVGGEDGTVYTACRHGRYNKIYMPENCTRALLVTFFIHV